ncbi:tRNA (adenosine(37)-N6)-threonylcarbamoyltransferase complex dimerization subunit type 1 TsaB [Gaoshiqia sp. Z1-71]|uniref:tRNA (adenosine(37)-N6)-threonylcarbamoyltransferase complex dimerization subunit type 1 TsaB n=1 Tax=Gaoshiqia hydrogeniformans TaxID=3290090 RepID=UPI003BF82728
MAFILNLESSTDVCSVALSENGQLIDIVESDEGQNHARLLSVFAQEIMQKNKLEFNRLSAVAVSRGPGSYTGLRIGVSLAKGLCYANQLPLIAINPLQAMSLHISSQAGKWDLAMNGNQVFCPMIDARRMEVYTALYNAQGEELAPVSAKLIDQASFLEIPAETQLVIFGNGAAKCREVMERPNVLFIDGIKTSAQFMCSLSNKALENNEFADLAYFEPFYLKDFIAGKPRKNILNR